MLDCLIWRGIEPDKATARWPPESKSGSLECFAGLASSPPPGPARGQNRCRSQKQALVSISARHHQTARVGTRCQGRCGTRPSLAGVQRADKPRARQRPRERSCGRANSLLVPMHGSFGLGRFHGVRWPRLCPPRGRCGAPGSFPRPAGQRAGRLQMRQRSRRCQSLWLHAVGYRSSSGPRAVVHLRTSAVEGAPRPKT